ncbi:MAG TPA: class I lanthipeptide [Thermoanaerobaculia bacterium]|nr:class I lanthipeptide [Thermoanaerobaculia bacterium]
MRKRNGKLTLSRETLRNLDASRLKEVAGGLFTYDPGACGTTCRCLDDPGTFSAECTIDCPTTSLG